MSAIAKGDMEELKRMSEGMSLEIYRVIHFKVFILEKILGRQKYSGSGLFTQFICKNK